MLNSISITAPYVQRYIENMKREYNKGKPSSYEVERQGVEAQKTYKKPDGNNKGRKLKNNAHDTKVRHQFEKAGTTMANQAHLLRSSTVRDVAILNASKEHLDPDAGNLKTDMARHAKDDDMSSNNDKN